MTNDFLHTYAWDSNGRPVTVDGVGVTYDALGDMVEQNRSGTYTEIAYAPSLGKLALMSGTTLQKGFVPLTGGAAAVYNSSGLAYYRHSDWLGSSRFASTTSQTMYFDGAYAPFSEPYAQTGTSDLSFTGQNQDTVSNLYDFPAREYGIQGRWPSPDPAGIGAVNPADPQSWNRYAYVRNSPLNITDPTGMLFFVDDPDSGGGGGGGGDPYPASPVSMPNGCTGYPGDPPVVVCPTPDPCAGFVCGPSSAPGSGTAGGSSGRSGGRGGTVAVRRRKRPDHYPTTGKSHQPASWPTSRL